MPIAHTRYAFKYEELSDNAKQTAVETVAGKLGGEWWDSNDSDRVSEAITYKLAEIFQSPEWDTTGEGDFPGIDGITMSGWNLDRGSYILASGTVTRENAPGLPWSDSIAYAILSDQRSYVQIDVALGDIAFTCATCGQDALWEAGIDDGPRHIIQVPGGNVDDDATDADHKPVRANGFPDRERARNEFKQTLSEALDAALTAGRAEAEFIGSEENARDSIEANYYDFNEDGSLF